MKRRVFLLAVLALASCDQNMVDQPKNEAYETSTLFPDGMVNRTPVDGTVARGDLEREKPLKTCPPLDRPLLERGRERYAIYCAPCHGPLGDGRGMVVQRGFPTPPSFHEERLRNAQAQHFVSVISNGKGEMFSYASRVEPADRCAIAGYIKALQLSQRFPAGRLTETERAAMDAPPDRGAR